jgi:hypothetical protein
MASAWGQSWGLSWGGSWGPVVIGSHVASGGITCGGAATTIREASGVVIDVIDVALEILDGQYIEPGITVRQALRLILAATAGKVSGAATETVAIRNAGDTRTRITATVDAYGNRSAVNYDLSDG